MADGAAFFGSQVSPEPRKPFDIGKFFTTVIKQEDPWTPAQAFLCIIVGAASCDGNISPEENGQILATIHRSLLFKEAKGEDLRAINNVVLDRISKRGRRAIADACTALPPDYARAAFAHAVDVVLADGGFVRAEADYLDDLMRMLGITEPDAAKIAEVLSIKNAC